MYANRRWVLGVMAGYMVGPEEMRDWKGNCPMIVTLDVKIGEQGEDDNEGQGSDEGGVNLPPRVQWPEEGDDDRCQQPVQQVQVKMRRGATRIRRTGEQQTCVDTARRWGSRKTSPSCNDWWSH